MTKDDERRARLAAELRANLRRRKAQVRAGAASPRADDVNAVPDDQPDR